MADVPFRSKEQASHHGEDAEDDDEIDETSYKQVKDAVLLAIEVSESMLVQHKEPKGADSSSSLQAALKCAYHLLQQRIISAPRDLIGIILYGTELSKFYDEDETTRGGWSFPHCYLLIDLSLPEADEIKTLKQLTQDEDDALAAQLFQPATDPVPMHSVLFCANQVFQQRASTFLSRRLFIITDNDNPHAGDKSLRAQATVRAKDLYDLGVTIELFPISTKNHTFESKLFWDDMIYKVSPSDPDAILYTPSPSLGMEKLQLKAGANDGISLLQSLISEVSSRAVSKRALFSAVALELAPDFRIGVKGYLLYKHQKPARSTYIYLDGERPEIVKGQTTMYADDFEAGSRNVQKAEVKKAYTFGGQQVTFSQDEMKSLRDFGEPIIRIIGFKPADCLPLWANFKSSTFLYPSEEDFVGSTRTFSALYQKLAKDKLMGLTWFIARRNAAPVLAALIPTLVNDDSESNISGCSVTGCPQGLHLIPLPFADDVRQNPPGLPIPPVRAPDELVDRMRDIIGQLNLPKGLYDASKYPNPSLQWHYRILQAIALEEDLPEQPEDKTRPRYRQIDKRVGELAVAWGASLEDSYKQHISSNPGAADPGSKRPPARSKTNGATADGKRVKSEGNEPKEEDVRKLYSTGKLDSMTVAQLKDFANAKGISVAGRKADLVERVEGWFERK